MSIKKAKEYGCTMSYDPGSEASEEKRRKKLEHNCSA